VRCLEQPDRPCTGPSTLLRERLFVIRGADLERARSVIFRGRPGAHDDAAARPTKVRTDEIVALVPPGAHSGRLTVVANYGLRGTSSWRVRVRKAPRPKPVDIAPGSRFFFDGRRRPTFAFDVPQPTQTTVELVHEETGEVVRSWPVTAQPGQRAEVHWDGRGTRTVQTPGTYRFRFAGSAGTANTEGSTSFRFADHLFRIRGPHNLGYTNTNRFGGGRGHQGIDMFSRCGPRLAVARGGRVQYTGYQARAGWYAVVDGRDTGVDYVYMHMRGPALVQTGQRVFTGQKLGQVGDSGNASGCHLHFEKWSSPGWYEGGRPLDPTASLRLWESYG